MKNKLYHIIALALIMATYSLTSAQGEAELSLKTDVTQAAQNQEFDVDIMLKNPSAEAIISVRSWLEYDSNLLQALSIDTQNTPFTLAAPGEDEIDAANGQVKIGRSNITGGATDAETKVATVRFRVIGANAANTALRFYDYQISELGHTSVNIIDGGFPLNVLSKEPEAIQIQLNPGVVTTPPVIEIPETPVETTIPPTIETPVNVGGNANQLLRPDQLKANTGEGFIDLVWNAPVDANRVGFNLYYGQTSGQYSRRRTLGNVNSYRLDGLTNGETYYLAVTAYDVFNQESEYSNEVGIIVNQPLSSTHPFEGLLQAVHARIPYQPQNGPLVGWMAFSAAGLAGSIVYRKKK